MIKALISLVAFSLAPGHMQSPAPGPATGAEDWVRVWRSKSARGYVDRSSYVRTDALVRYEERIVLKRPDRDGVSMMSGTEEADCVRRTTRTLRFAGLRPDGTVVSGHVFPGGGPAQVVKPGTNAEKVLKFVCSTSVRRGA